MKSEQNTPMIQAFLNVKKDYPDKLLFYRMGDFYELFYEDAVEASKILGITLTKRGQSGGKDIPMAGVPFHAVNNYINKALGKGKSVVICDQVGAPGKGLMERQVTKIMTPGTIIDNDIIDSKENRYLMSIFKKGEQVDISWVNFSTGEIWCSATTFSECLEEINRISPSEIIISEKQVRFFGFNDIVVTTIPEWEYDKPTSNQNLINIFGEQYVYKFGLEKHDFSHTISSLINYLKETQRTNITHIQNIRYYNNNDYVHIDSNTKKHLELICNKNNNSLWHILDYCSTPMGSRRLKEWISQPIRNRDIINSRLDRVEYLKSGKKPYLTWNKLSEDWCDIDRITTKISLKTVKPRELANLRNTLRSMSKLNSWMNELPLNIKGLIQHALPNDNISKILEKYLIEEPSVWVRDGGVIANGIDCELDEARELQNGHSKYIKEYEEKQKILHNIPNLKVDYNSAQGFFISVSNSHLGKIPQNYKRKQTLKNAERFTTDELMEYEDKAMSAKARALNREKILYIELLQKLQPYVNILQKQSSILAEWDILSSFAKVSHENKYKRPTFNETNIIEMVNGRHPTVEKIQNNFVANDLTLDRNNNLVIITGPNMGGKSTLMRQMAIISIMSYIGCFVPADKFSITDIDAVYTRIGSGDDISQGRSTFMLEMAEAAYIANNATKKSLVLLDELGRGTATYDGLSLAWSIAKYLGNKKKSFTLLATHYLEMTELENIHTNIKNYHFSATEHQGNIILNHKLELGSASKSYGIHVASLAGVPLEILSDAKMKLASLELKQQQLESSIENELKQIDVTRMTPLEALNWIMEKKNELR